MEELLRPEPLADGTEPEERVVTQQRLPQRGTQRESVLPLALRGDGEDQRGIAQCR